jgi:hypothetical protein
MAVRPYMGAIMEPDEHPANNPAAPDCSFELEYVYGYRCADSRQNVYFNNKCNAVYMTAALGVILDHGSNTQKFFGGGQVANTSKQTANDMESHTNDITSIAMSTDRSKACSGQVGSAPCALFGTQLVVASNRDSSSQRALEVSMLLPLMNQVSSSPVLISIMITTSNSTMLQTEPLSGKKRVTLTRSLMFASLRCQDHTCAPLLAQGTSSSGTQ